MVNSQKQHTKKSSKVKDRARPVTSERKAAELPKDQFEQIIFRDWCKGCGICSAFCPKKVIERDEAGAPVIQRSEDCIGCRFCELHCPDFAITILERKKKEN